MGAPGRAITFVTREQGKELTQVEMLVNQELTPLGVEGFEPSGAPPTAEEPKPEPSFARFREPVFSPADGSQDLPAKAPPKTLGSKFRPRRRRRI
jgi:hypothetical protein